MQGEFLLLENCRQRIKQGQCRGENLKEQPLGLINWEGHLCTVGDVQEEHEKAKEQAGRFFYCHGRGCGGDKFRHGRIVPEVDQAQLVTARMRGPQVD